MAARKYEIIKNTKRGKNIKKKSSGKAVVVVHGVVSLPDQIVQIR